MTATESAPSLAATAASRTPVVPVRSTLPALVVVAGVIIGLTTAQGGYFPTSWGLTATLLLWAVGLWIVVSGRTDADWLDLVFLGLFTAYTFWVGLSIAWSIVPAESVLELERTVLVLAGVTAVLALSRNGDVERIAGVVLVAITIVSTYSLGTRLFPDRIGSYDPVAGYRLSDPLGYWNSLGVFAVMGIMLALGIAAEARRRWTRAAGAAALVPLAATLYYTYSRGSWIALAIGVGVWLVFTPRRLRTLATALVVAVPPTLAVLAASRPEALTHSNASLARSAHAGHRAAIVLLALVGLAVLVVLALHAVQRRIDVPARLRFACGVVVVIVLLAMLAGALAREGNPSLFPRRVWHSFSASPTASGPDLNGRLFSFSGNGRVELWRAAQDLASAHPVVGSGAGTFERYWQSRTDATFKVRDAHSLYVETLAELGPPGLALLIAALLVPVVGAFLARRQTFVPAALAAYVAFLVHAGVDWDWELSGVTLTALLIGSLLVIGARGKDARELGTPLRALCAVGAVVASMAMIIAYLGNGALGKAESAVLDKSYATAVADANRARRLMPWSPWPYIMRGDAELVAGDPTAARASYRHAVAIDSGEWRAWLGLALSSTGRSRTAALARARSLYPTSLEIAAAAARLKHTTNG